METKYIHTAWAENFISKEDAEDIMDTLGCCDEEKKFEDFERVVHLSEQEKEMVEELSIIGKRKELK